jgi:hypothetical protein
LFGAALAAIACAGAPVLAWEAQTTHAGLAEQAALASVLHKRLVTLGFSGGLFEPLTIPPADAPALLAALKLMSPAHGIVPDARGRQGAMAWLAAGAALADVPAAHGANHFYDPTTGRGWDKPSRGVFVSLAAELRGVAQPPDHGVPAPDWIVAKDNPFGYDAFLDEYAKAITAATPGERSRDMAAALIAAGAMLHALGDLGVPSRVRGDEAAHFSQLGGGPDDVGSRFERIAALAFGRLGVPAPSQVITRAHVRDYFTAAPRDRTVAPKSASPDVGLADLIARSYFSLHTLPRASRTVGADSKPQLVKPLPALPTRLNLMAASREDGTTLRDRNGTCLARYKVEHSTLEFSLDDDCALEQVTAILPVVASYETGLLDFLFRGELTLVVDAGGVIVGGKNLGNGQLTILVEDDRGVRTELAKTPLPDGQQLPAGALAHANLPTTGARLIAMFRGVDNAGEPIVAGGAIAMPK